MMVLSFVPSRRAAEPLTIEEAAATAEIVDRMEGTHRLLIHGRVNPNQDGDMQGMDELAERWKVSAWKTYTQWGPDGKGYFLSDDIGLAFIDKARKLGIKNICVHKGIPFGRQSYEHSLCNDIGQVAKRYPDVNFLIYHSGFVPGQPEGPYDPARKEGIDSLIKTVVENEQRLRDKHGYPEITPKLRAKVFGLNAMKPYRISAEEMKRHTAHDRIANDRIAYREAPNPHFRTNGPRTRREFLNLLAWNGGQRT